MKELLVSHQVLKLLDLSKPFFVTLSFSQFGSNAVLFQKDEKILRPIFYRSKTINSSVLKPRYL